MRQVRTVLSTYSADAFGVCSALFELGGMIVMHDASGCNSTYSTHDEPRWYHTNSLVFISGLTEMDAIMGNDGKLVQDMLTAIRELHPAFAAIVGTPIPMINGCDLVAIAKEVEMASGIPCFGFPTNGMRSYLCGASEALAAIADRMTDKLADSISDRMADSMADRKADRMADRNAKKHTGAGAINILGATPLDFSLSGTIPSIRAILNGNGWEVIGTWAMDSTLADLVRAGEAEVNLVVSSVGLKTAQLLNKLFGTPYVVGTPVGAAFTEKILADLRASAKDGQNRISFSDFVPEVDSRFILIGESVTSRSLASAIYCSTGVVPKVVYTLEALPELRGVLSNGDMQAVEEEEILSACANAQTVIADPLYRPVLPKDCHFIPLPHEAFSGRMYRKSIPDLTQIDCTAMICRE